MKTCSCMIDLHFSMQWNVQKKCFEMFMSFHNEYMCLNSNYNNYKSDSSFIHNVAAVRALFEYYFGFGRW